MALSLQFRRGKSTMAPDLKDGEPGFNTDNKRMLIGTSTTENVEFYNTEDIDIGLGGKADKEHQHVMEDITDLSIPDMDGLVLTTDPRLSDSRLANGGNADTVDNKHASDFVLTNDPRLSDSRLANGGNADTVDNKHAGDFANATHKSNHAIGGSDVLTPSDIGAATAVHTHSGSVVQLQHYQTGEIVTGTTILPIDDTIPQNSEGTQFLSVSITPKSASNILVIDVVLALRCSATQYVTAALFQDSGVNALAAFTNWPDAADDNANINFRHKMTAGTTSSTTFKVRVGPNSDATVAMNGTSAGARKFGGVMASSITVIEIAA